VEMEAWVLALVLCVVALLILIKAGAMYFARRAARNAYRTAISTEISQPRPVRRPVGMDLFGDCLPIEPRRPEHAVLGDNRYERSPEMEAPPVYSKDDTLPGYHDITAPEAVHHAGSS
jgi:hypothetical protein